MLLPKKTVDVQGTENTAYTLGIYNTSGQLIFEEESASWPSIRTLELNEEDGLYLIRLQIGDKEYVEKLMIRRK